jgi:hypothetical protein
MADDTKPNETSLALLNAKMDSLAREVGALDRDDPKRADLVKEIFRLSELAAEMRREEKLRGHPLAGRSSRHRLSRGEEFVFLSPLIQLVSV